jgi:hypothetical protein
MTGGNLIVDCENAENSADLCNGHRARSAGEQDLFTSGSFKNRPD